MRLYLNSTRVLLMQPLWLLSAGTASGAAHGAQAAVQQEPI
jgi:hypothetical protein